MKIEIEKELYDELIKAKEQYDKFRKRVEEYQKRNRKKITEYHNAWARKKREANKQ